MEPQRHLFLAGNELFCGGFQNAKERTEGVECSVTSQAALPVRPSIFFGSSFLSLGPHAAGIGDESCLRLGYLGMNISSNKTSHRKATSQNMRLGLF